MRSGTRGLIAATVVAGLLGAAGCGGSDSPQPAGTAPVPGLHELTLDAGGEQREYLLDVPQDYRPDEPTPLIVVLHAGRSNAAEIREVSGMASLARDHGVLVAYPQGADGWWRPIVRGEHGVGVRWGDEPVDVEFVRRLVTHLVEHWNAAPGQVYATGHSNGAAMSYRLAVEAADVFAAVAPVGGYIFDPPTAVEPTRPVSVVGFVSGNSRSTEEIAEGMHIWRDLFDCPPGDPADAGDRVTRTTARCHNGSDVVEYEIAMGHVWPRPESHGIDANQVMWEFFSAHARTD